MRRSPVSAELFSVGHICTACVCVGTCVYMGTYWEFTQHHYLAGLGNSWGPSCHPDLPRGRNPCALQPTRLAALWFPRGCCLCPFPSASVTWSAREHQAASVLQMPTKRRCLRTGSCPQEGCLSLTGGSACSPRPDRLHSPACWDHPENVVPARLPPPRLVCPRWSGSPVLPSGEGGVQLCLQAAEPWLGP